uniref:Flagellar associated protein 107 n=1 Tax=Dunaliella salina TaxID=3046 RepID=G9JJW7_DUNSA|nr:flagellar associated protein 107 [Dunaliella salina]
MEFSERWTRGAGSGGLGQSGHKNEYRHGVLISNFVEDGAKVDFSKTGKHLLGFGEPFQTTSTHRADYNPEGKTGDDLLFVSQREDQRLNTKGLPGGFLTRHGDFAGPRENFYATMNQLAYGPKQHGDPRVDTFMWTGQNRHDAGVPLNTVGTSRMDLSTTKRQQWHEEADSNPYATSTRSAQHSTALPAAEHPSKTQTLPPVADSGHLATVGRKPKGQHADELDKNYRRTGLRDNWQKP